MGIDGKSDGDVKGDERQMARVIRGEEKGAAEGMHVPASRRGERIYVHFKVSESEWLAMTRERGPYGASFSEEAAIDTAASILAVLHDRAFSPRVTDGLLTLTTLTGRVSVPPAPGPNVVVHFGGRGIEMTQTLAIRLYDDLRRELIRVGRWGETATVADSDAVAQGRNAAKIGLPPPSPKLREAARALRQAAMSFANALEIVTSDRTANTGELVERLTLVLEDGEVLASKAAKEAT